MIDTNIHELNKAAEEKRVLAKQQADEAAQKAGQAGVNIAQAAASAATSANATLEEFGIYPEQMAETARRKTTEMQDALISEIRDNPLRSVAIAALFGYFFALYRRV